MHCARPATPRTSRTRMHSGSRWSPTATVLAAPPLGVEPACRSAGKLKQQIVQLRKGLVHRVLRAGADGVERFLRRVEVAHDDQSLAAFFLEGHGGDGSILSALFIGPDDARVRSHLDVTA